MILDLIVNNLVQAIYIMDLVLILALFVLERNNPSRALFWIIVLVFLPIVGFVLYLFFGMNCITIVLLGGLLGFLWSTWRERRKGGSFDGTP